jgi:hypothetical protein
MRARLGRFWFDGATIAFAPAGSLSSLPAPACQLPTVMMTSQLGR